MTAEGNSTQIHPMAIIHPGAELAADYDAEDLVGKLNARYAMYIGRLQAQSFSRSSERKVMRSF